MTHDQLLNAKIILIILLHSMMKSSKGKKSSFFSVQIFVYKQLKICQYHIIGIIWLFIMYFIFSIFTAMLFFSCVSAKSEECFIKEFSSNVTVEVHYYRKMIKALGNEIVFLYIPRKEACFVSTARPTVPTFGHTHLQDRRRVAGFRCSPSS